MDNMEHAIEHAARTLFLSDRGDTLPAGFPERQWDEGHAIKDDYLRRARALADAGLLAPAPLHAELRDSGDLGLTPGAFTQSRWATAWELGGGPVSSDPLDPVRRILDNLATETEPPCDHITIYEANQKAIHDISVYVYPEARE